MGDMILSGYVWQRTARAALADRLVAGESGEGVISAAIAVLVMAFLGVLMWQLFRGTLTESNGNVNRQLREIE